MSSVPSRRGVPERAADPVAAPASHRSAHRLSPAAAGVRA